jgi:hypothetical protein
MVTRQRTVLTPVAMTDQKPNRLFGSSPMTTVAMVIYFGVGYGLIKKFWPNSDVGLWILIAAGIVGYVFVLWRQRDQR